MLWAKLGLQLFTDDSSMLKKRLRQKGEKVHNDKVIKEVADALASGSKIHLKQSKMLRKTLGSPVPKRKKRKK